MRLRWLILLLLLLASPVLAQNTVTGTITDANGNAYANGTVSAIGTSAFGLPAGATVNGATNSSGAFSISLPNGNFVFTVCAAPTLLGVPTVNNTPKLTCFSNTAPISISGSGDISTQLNAYAVLLGPKSGGGSPAGNTGQVQIANSGALGAITPGFIKQGTVIPGDGADWTSQEPSVIDVTALPLILTSTTIPTGARVLGICYDSGYNPQQLNYAEMTSNGGTPTYYSSNPILSSHFHATCVKIGTTYYVTAANALTGGGIDIESGSSLLSLSSLSTNIVQVGASGAWDNAALGNSVFWKDLSGNWYLQYDGQASGGNWSEGYATCGSGASPSFPCSKFAGNPTMSAATVGGTLGDPRSLRQISANLYYMMPHGTPSGQTGVTPTDCYAYKSTNLSSWTEIGSSAILWRTQADEGAANSNGQVADCFPIDMGNGCSVFFTKTANGNSAPTGFPGFGIGLAVDDLQTCDEAIANGAIGVTPPPERGLVPFSTLRTVNSAGTSVSNNTSVQIETISLTPGTWQIWGHGQLSETSASSSTLTYASVCLATANNGCGAAISIPGSITAFPGFTLAASSANAWDAQINTATVRVTATTTFYLLTFDTISSGATTITAKGEIDAQQIY